MKKTTFLIERVREIVKKKKDIGVGNLVVRDIMSTDVITITPDELIVNAAEKMLDYRIHALVVVEDKKPVGIITTYDLGLVLTIRKFDEATPVGKLMVTDLITVHPDDPLLNVLEKVIGYNIRRLIVVQDDKLVGIVSLIDLMLGFTELPDEIIKG
ncbi:MAG: CBS domain-containing protein [Candidatus Altiarchaeales archaeon]|nr:CBS domain-containing protein [Candidatus Altiarchaeales archaeon]